MTWEVLRDDTTLNKIINIELHLESAHNDELSLSTIELLKEISGIAFELRVAVIDTHATFDLKQLTHHIDHDVVTSEATVNSYNRRTTTVCKKKYC